MVGYGTKHLSHSSSVAHPPSHKLLSILGLKEFCTKPIISIQYVWLTLI